MKTLNQSNRKIITGDYLRYYENDELVIVLALTAHLHVIRKVLRTPRHMTEAWFPSVINFLIHEDQLYYVTTNNNIFICNLSNEKIQSSLLIHMEDGIMCMGHKNGYLNVLTYLRNIFTVVDEVNVFRRTLDDSQNLFHELVKYNLLDNLDWRVFFLWLFILNRTIPHNSIRNIIVTKVYGDVVFVGSILGVFRIYCSPYLNNEFDIFNTEPVKQYNFMERSDCPVLSDSPIIQIDVIEGEDSHTVLVGMPKKIAVIKFRHDIQLSPSKIDLGDLQIIEVNDTL
ncbi:jg4654 [Pararge aegeria aegeria]|uniref:Jg4654 protein n=2 Tax=Pararge aegeria TaxID=116150 RepID=A0A8S4QIW6_9NEOP|nr:jg4654 [Pararge aegeria aegeria]